MMTGNRNITIIVHSTACAIKYGFQDLSLNAGTLQPGESFTYKGPSAKGAILEVKDVASNGSKVNYQIIDSTDLTLIIDTCVTEKPVVYKNEQRRLHVHGDVTHSVTSREFSGAERHGNNKDIHVNWGSSWTVIDYGLLIMGIIFLAIWATQKHVTIDVSWGIGGAIGMRNEWLLLLAFLAFAFLNIRRTM